MANGIRNGKRGPHPEQLVSESHEGDGEDNSPDSRNRGGGNEFAKHGESLSLSLPS